MDEPKKKRIPKSVFHFMGGMLCTVLLATVWVVLIRPTKAPVAEPTVVVKVGDIVPISGTRHLEFAGLTPMTNNSDEVFAAGDHCRGTEHSTLEIQAMDDKRMLLVYRERRELPSHSVGGIDVTAEDARPDCPDKSPIVCSPEEWREIVRAYSVSGGSRANLREWVRQHLPSQTPPR